jgi:hypothetical protein
MDAASAPHTMSVAPSGPATMRTGSCAAQGAVQGVGLGWLYK